MILDLTWNQIECPKVISSVTERFASENKLNYQFQGADIPHWFLLGKEKRIQISAGMENANQYLYLLPSQLPSRQELIDKRKIFSLENLTQRELEISLHKTLSEVWNSF